MLYLVGRQLKDNDRLKEMGFLWLYILLLYYRIFINQFDILNYRNKQLCIHKESIRDHTIPTLTKIDLHLCLITDLRLHMATRVVSFSKYHSIEHITKSVHRLWGTLSIETIYLDQKFLLQAVRHLISATW